MSVSDQSLEKKFQLKLPQKIKTKINCIRVKNKRIFWIKFRKGLKQMYYLGRSWRLPQLKDKRTPEKKKRKIKLEPLHLNVYHPTTLEPH